MTVRQLLGVLLGLFFTLTVRGDTLYLRDGGEVEGTFLGGDSRSVRLLREDGRVESFSLTEVESLVFRGGASTSQAPSGRSLSSSSPYHSVSPVDAATLMAGTRVVVRTIESIDSDIHQPGDTFQATLEAPLTAEGVVVAEKGSFVMVQLVHVKQSGKIRGEEEVALQLRSITVNNRTYPLATDFAEVASEGKGGETAKAATGAGVVGAIIGAITGGAKGAAVGAATGAGGATVIQAIRGKRVKIPSESRLSFTLEESVTLG